MPLLKRTPPGLVPTFLSLPLRAPPNRRQGPLRPGQFFALLLRQRCPPTASSQACTPQACAPRACALVLVGRASAPGCSAKQKISIVERTDDGGTNWRRRRC